MFGDRLLAAGGAKVVGVLAMSCIVLGLLLAASLAGHWVQFRGSARLAADLGAKLAAAEARGRAEIEACTATNARVAGTVRVLEQELHACRGQEQRIREAHQLALRQRERARREAEGQERMRREAVDAIARNDEDCRRPLCRALSDELLGTPAAR
jgi:hypothetical protein